MMKKTISASALCLLTLISAAQSVTYDQFSRLVAEKNIGYLAQKYDIDKSEASLQAARVFNDPELSVTYGNNQDWDLQMGQSVEVGLSVNPDLAGVRRARIAVAGTENELTKASVAAYLTNLRFEAAQAWAEAWQLRESCAVLEKSLADLEQIAQSDSLRFSLGDISRADAMQSRLEAQTLKGALATMRADYVNALSTVSVFCGGQSIDDISGNLSSDFPVPPESEITSLAEINRADLKAAQLSKTLSENNLKLLRASRAFELGIDIGYSYNKEVLNEIAPAPRFNGLSVGVTIPLKFSSFNKGEVHAAQADILQSEKYYEQACLQVRSEASQAYKSLVAAVSVRSQYTDSILEDTEDIMRARKTGYLKGESSLVELLSAQQTYFDVMQSYINACCNSFLCMARLEQATGCIFSR